MSHSSVRAPNDFCTNDDNYGVFRASAGPQSTAIAAPLFFAGKYVELYVATGSPMQYAFSTRADAALNVNSPSSGVEFQVGGYLFGDGTRTQKKVPPVKDNQSLYIVVQCQDSAGTVFHMELAE